MAEFFTTRRMSYWALFLALSFMVVFVRILPLNLPFSTLPGPGWTIAIAFAWVLRRPNLMPVLLFAGVMLLSDIIYLRPPGLWTAISIVGLEFLRGRARFSRELPFLFEWVLVAVVMLAMTLANRVILGTFIVAQPDLAMDALQFAITLAVYPLTVLVSVFVLGVRHPTPGTLDEMGHRI